MLMSEYNYEQDLEVQREEAFEDGFEKGCICGEERLTTLITKLSKDNRNEDILQIAYDSNLREKLYKEYGL